MYSAIQYINHYWFNLRYFKLVIGLLVLISIVYNTYQYTLKLELNVHPGATNKQVVSNRTNNKKIDDLGEKKLLETCPLIPPNLGTRISVDLVEKSIKEIELYLKNISIASGGFSSPTECVSHTKVALVVPYRNRDHNLKLFLKHIHPFLSKQQLDYGIYIVEPMPNLEFNRGLLMNIGFLEALKLSGNKWQCFIFHDVDLLPEDERNLYTCAEKPRHMSAAVSTLLYRLPYDIIFGGVTAISREQMKKANGYSNLYFGWGGEDDDFRARFVHKNYEIARYPLEIGRYYMAKHEKDHNINADRHKLLKNVIKNQDFDGLNTIQYTVVNTTAHSLYTHVLVTYDKKKLFSENKKISLN